MRVSFIQPRKELRPYIESFWVLESATGMAVADQNLAAPNGCSKLLIPYENSLLGTWEGRTGVSREHGMYFIGNRDTATLIHSSARKTGLIGIEFFPHGAFPIFGIPMQETTEQMFDSELLFGRWGRDTREAVCNLEEVDKKIEFIQDELARLSRRNRLGNGVIDYCVTTLKLTHGRMPVKELERKTGYTRRYLSSLFGQYVGLSPKVLSEIFRFQRFYQKWARGVSYDVFKEEVYDYYYDQAHFAKEFKRMTGHAPRKFTTDISNELGRRLAG